MAEYPNDDLTPEQRAVIAEAESAALRRIRDARSRLVELGLEFKGEPGDFSCTRCDCDSYRGVPLQPCRTPRCGHAFTLHNVT
ncbi:hypothetical protein [Thermomonospora umbrina]|uniref:Uncharacterized protein n=1 Tax=Thermomonospora umbrina TaxID=111806 RepID=A0A3D9SQT5_9ACTN|nr:hypothetical protein [Thermomonospora umbrina]REE96860.1 hypothetical protein DFJ69_2313 [Thermomonospora umbrina]